MIRRKVLSFVVLSILWLIIPVSLLLSDFMTPSPYRETYYGELSALYEKLTDNDGRSKIVIIGNSSVAFGVDSALMEEELRFDGKDYRVCNFGLYIAIGTKTMLDLSRDHINAGDIVIFAPELNTQCLSLYFSPLELWRSLDGNWKMLKNIDGKNLESMVGAYPSFIAEKQSLRDKGNSAAEGVYASASFDSNGDMKNADRPYNIMVGGYDANDVISLDDPWFTDEFCEYVNEYCAFIRQKGAAMYFSFCPRNEMSIADKSPETVEGFYNAVASHFDFPIISDPNTYIMDKDWFYDTNVHLNSAGMTVHTINLISDIKNVLGITTPVRSEIPEKPQSPETNTANPLEGDNTAADLFTYADYENGVKITGLTEEGRQQANITIPASYEEKAVLCFEASVFAGNTTIREITVQENIRILYDGSFEGCTLLERIILLQENPEAISVGLNLMSGAENASIYLKEKAVAAFMTNYSWSQYTSYYKSIETAQG